MYVAKNDSKLYAQDGRYDGYNFVNENAERELLAVLSDLGPVMDKSDQKCQRDSG